MAIYRDHLLAIQEGAVDQYRRGREDADKVSGPMIAELRNACRILHAALNQIGTSDPIVTNDADQDSRLIDAARRHNSARTVANKAIADSRVRYIRDAISDDIPF